MGKNELNMSDVMKYSRHDHMNELQLLLMYLDMGKYKEARDCILEKTAAMQQLAMLQKLCMPHTEEWLTTLDWRYPVFTSRLHCDITSKIEAQQIDAVLVEYLEGLVQTVMPMIDQYAECPVEITVKADAAGWRIQMTFSEIHANQINISESSSLLTVEVHEGKNQWTFTISGRLGGN